MKLVFDYQRLLWTFATSLFQDKSNDMGPFRKAVIYTHLIGRDAELCLRTHIGQHYNQYIYNQMISYYSTPLPQCHSPWDFSRFAYNQV